MTSNGAAAALTDPALLWADAGRREAPARTTATIVLGSFGIALYMVGR